MSGPAASVVVRSKDKESTITDALLSLRRQSVDVEIILVDSGSTDGTLERAAPYIDRLIQFPAAQFTFGRALNLGAAEASAPITFALSAHCAAPSPLWVEESLQHYDDPRVAATCGWDHIDAPHIITFADVRDDPYGRFSNHACSWRSATWAQFPFDETLRSSEDQEWLWRVMVGGWIAVADPRLVVSTGHRRAGGLPALWKRVYWEHRVVAERLQYPTTSATELAQTWWSEFPWASKHPKWQRRVSPWRNVELLAGFLGERVGEHHRDGRTISLPDGR